MAKPDQQQRTAEISRILAANGWGITEVSHDGAAVVVTIQKPTASFQTGTFNEHHQALIFLVQQFRWDVTDFATAKDQRVAKLRTV